MGRDRQPPVVDVDTIAHRYSSYDTPFWARGNTQPGRWHAHGDGATQYLSLSTDGAWAELIRNEELTTEDEVEMVSVQMWAVAVHQAMVVDYSTFERAERAGFDPDGLVDEDHTRCQREGARVRALGYSGVLAPSAALPGEVNLTLFGPRTASTWNRPPLLVSSLPATIIAKGAPPHGLLGRIRRIGAPHGGLVAYRSTREKAGNGRETGNEPLP
jgi:RES domain-containing protein